MSISSASCEDKRRIWDIYLSATSLTSSLSIFELTCFFSMSAHNQMLVEAMSSPGIPTQAQIPASGARQGSFQRRFSNGGEGDDSRSVHGITEGLVRQDSNVGDSVRAPAGQISPSRPRISYIIHPGQHSPATFFSRNRKSKFPRRPSGGHVPQGVRPYLFPRGRFT